MARFGCRVAVCAAGLAWLQTGCSTLSNTEKGAGIGGALGAGVGTAIGAATGNPRTGAVAGGLIGAGTGALIGNDVDREEKREADIRQAEATALATATAQQEAGRLGMTDVIQLVQQGQSEAVIVNQIRATGSTFQLSTQDLAYLKSCGVPDGVIVAMQTARPQPVMVRPGGPQTVVVREPAVVYADPWWPRPVYWGPPAPMFGITYVHRRR